MIAAHMERWLEIAWQWIWNATLPASMLAVLLLVLQPWCRRFLSARWLYALWVCVVLRLIIPAVPAAPFGLLTWISRKDLIITTERIGSPPIPMTKAADGFSEVPRTIGHANNTVGTAPRDISFLRVAQLLWLLGVLGFLAVVLGQHRRWARWIKHAPLVKDPRLIAILLEAKQSAGCRAVVTLVESNSLKAPCLFGFRKPKLLLPKSLNLSDSELRLVLMHELMHVKRRDVLLNWVMIVVQALHWFNPVIWLAMRWLRAARESVCDELVISRLQTEERNLYGVTLIKLIDSFSGVPSTFIPIINRKKQMHQRIVMIAKFKPTTRVMSAIATVLLLVLACFTFTRAAEKPLLQPPTAADKTEADKIKFKDAARRGIASLQKMLEQQDIVVRQKEEKLDIIKRELGISEFDEAVQAGAAESARKLQGFVIEAQAEQTQINAVLDQFRTLSRAELRKIISTAAPDQLLTSLFEQQASAEQKLAVLLETYGTEHPEVKTIRRLIERINTQINDRLDGILEGLKAKAASCQKRAANLEKQLITNRERDIETGIAHRPYLRAKRDLENAEVVRDRLRIRLIQEQIDIAVPRDGE